MTPVYINLLNISLYCKLCTISDFTSTVNNLYNTYILPGFFEKQCCYNRLIISTQPQALYSPTDSPGMQTPGL